MKNLKFIAFVLILVSCSFPQTTNPPTSTPQATSLPTASPSPEASLSFEAAVYKDDAGRFEISYPTDWMVDPQQIGSRGSTVQFTSWSHAAGGFNQIPAGGSVLSLTIYQWDPVRKLDERVAMRRDSWLSSGNQILEEGSVSYPGGHDGVRFLLQNTDGGKTVIVLLELGDDYLELSGTGYLPILEEIIRSFSFLDQ